MHQSVELCAAGEPSSARSARPSRSTSSSPRAGRTTSAPSPTPASSPSAPRLRSKAVTLFPVLERPRSRVRRRLPPLRLGLGPARAAHLRRPRRRGRAGRRGLCLSLAAPSPFPPTPAPPAALSRRREGLREREREREGFVFQAPHCLAAARCRDREVAAPPRAWATHLERRGDARAAPAPAHGQASCRPPPPSQAAGLRGARRDAAHDILRLLVAAAAAVRRPLCDAKQHFA